MHAGYEINIRLESGFYNSYWDLRKDRANEIGEISRWDRAKDDYELKELLNENKITAW